MLSEARLIIDHSPVLPLTELHARAQKLEEKQDAGASIMLSRYRVEAFRGRQSTPETIRFLRGSEEPYLPR